MKDMNETSRTVSGDIRVSGANGGDISSRRVDLLEAIDQQGSISAAAKQLSMSYRSAWDAVADMNNLWEQPLVSKSAGGHHGGGTRLTLQGRELISAFRLMQQEYQRFIEGLSRNLDNLDRFRQIMGRLSMRSSVRNQFQGRVRAINRGPVNSQVMVAMSDQENITAVVTTQSLEQMGLQLDKDVFALIKASFIILVDVSTCRLSSAANRLCGQINEVRHGTVNSEVIVELQCGKTLAAIITEHSATSEAFQVGQEVCALIDASHVILGVN